ncbi:hypothetical protein EIN_248170 [Entamoeba invadens IP1]|uniref:Uncharacterized protein n=1 Tax=Entamoeba invadens IP1 TaxID=370355 RepID=A0A0A1UED9_ENTIV|nr:hypothetical protein EIN_248170 [Entamoeba invadens IP1]ELP94853.1 hypothetical protein EIN_248170 [Entamoeba invadens IP1]|eukprot:XP_004261624.1 hypothetical protein EIN_248170 [Entamoeba invadens IP1]
MNKESRKEKSKPKYENAKTIKKNSRVEKLQRDCKILLMMQKLVGMEITNTLNLQDRLTDLFEDKFERKYQRPASPLHFKMSRVPMLDQEQIDFGVSFIKNPKSVDAESLQNFPQILPQKDEDLRSEGSMLQIEDMQFEEQSEAKSEEDDRVKLEELVLGEY